MITKPPCFNVHHFKNNIEKDHLICKDCDMILTRKDLIAAGNSKNKLLKIIKNKERDWYIKELES
jgi:hypothetical protein